MSRRKASSQQQLIVIAAVIVILLVTGIWYYTRSTEEPEPQENKAPIVVASTPNNFALVEEKISFTSEGSTDPDGEIVTYNWNMGDGTTVEGKDIEYSYQIPGNYIITLTIEDDDGASATNDVSPIFVKIDRATLDPDLESPPVALMAVSDEIIGPGEEVFFEGSSSYGWKERRGEIEPDTTKITKYTWDFGDGTTEEGLNFTHPYQDSGNYYVELTVEDGMGRTDKTARTIRVLPAGLEYEGEIKNPDTFTYAMDLTIRGQDLWRISGGNIGRGVVLALSDLLLFTGRGDLEAGTAGSVTESYEVSDDGLTYTFNLREGIEFWNGDELKAEDVEYTYERMMALTAARGRWSIMYERMTGIPIGDPVPDDIIKNAIETVDDYTVQFNFVENYAPFITDLGYPSTGIIQKNYAIENGAWSWDNPTDYSAIDGVDKPMEDGVALMCTGPFKVKEWSRGERIVFERNDNYWQGPASIKEARIIYVPEWSTRRLLLSQGDVDGIAVGPPEEFEQILEMEGVNPINVKYGGFVEVMYPSINFDPAQAPIENQVPPDFFADKHMRRAFAYAFPYERYIEEVWLGYAQAAKGVLPPGWPGSYENYPYEYNLEKAEEELKLAHGGKYYEEGFQVAAGCQFWAFGTQGRAYEMLGEELAKIDAKYKLVVVGTKWGDMLNAPMGMLVGVIRPDPVYYRNFYHTTGWPRYYGYNNPRVDELIEESTMTPFIEERLPLLKEAADIAADECPVIFTVFNPHLNAFRDYIGGFYFQVNHLTDWGYLYSITKGG